MMPQAFTDRLSARGGRESKGVSGFGAHLKADRWQNKKASAVPHASAILPAPKLAQP
jgi:hypothetical protein